MTTSALPKSCTFSEGDWQILACFWYPVALSSEVTPGPFSAQLLDKKLVVFRTQNGVSVLDDLCPHRGIPLSMGRITGNELICRGHGFRIDESGGICNGAASFQGAIQSYPAIEKYGLVWTCLEPTEATPAIPAFPQWDDPEFEPIPPVMIEMEAAAGRQVESFIDVAHFAWVHDKTFSKRDEPVVPKYDVVENELGVKSIFTSSQPNMPKEMHHLIPPGFQWVREYQVNLPFTVAFRVGLPGNHALAILNSASPVSARKTRLFAPTARTFDKGEPLDAFYKLQYQIFQEDQEIVEEQKPEDLPISLQEEVHIRADLVSITYRKALGNLGLGRMYTA